MSRRMLLLFVFFAVWNGGGSCAEETGKDSLLPPGGERTYQNPILDRRMADPTVVRYKGIFYLYVTGDVLGGGYRYWSSTDLVDWRRGPVVFRRRRCWAPDVWRDKASGKFYLYYTAQSSVNPDWQVVGVAESESPAGPFVDPQDLFENAIDAHLFSDEDGRLYLYFVQFPGFRITVQAMSSPRTPSGASRVILEPQEEWERRHGAVTEGPWMLKHNGRYYLLYSGSHAAYPDYAVGYATAEHPMGPFQRAGHNPIVRRSEGVFGPGHGCVLQDDAGNWWHFYHQKRASTLNDFDRFVCLDRLWFDGEGRLYGMASRGVRLPAPVIKNHVGP